MRHWFCNVMAALEQRVAARFTKCAEIHLKWRDWFLTRGKK